MNDAPYPLAAIGAGEIAAATPYGITVRPYPTDTIKHVSDLAIIALTKELPYRSLWIMPNDVIAERAKDPAFWAARDGWDIFATGNQNGARNAARICRHGAKGEAARNIQIFSDVASTNRWGIVPESTGHLANIMRKYEELMGVAAAFSPAFTARAALVRTCGVASRNDWLMPLAQSTIDALPIVPEIVPEFVNPYPCDGTHVHVVDGNAAYMRAAKHSFGCGEPVYLDTVSDDLVQRILAGKEYGCFCISAESPDTYDNIDPDPQMPSPWGIADNAFPEAEWFYAPQIALAHKQGWAIHIHEGWHWPVKHEVFKDWIERLWTARIAIRGTQTEALVKRSFNHAIGTFARPIDPDQKVMWYHRRDWASTIWAQNYLLQCLKIANIEKARRGAFLCVATDQIAWVGHDPNPDSDMPGILDRSEALGGYKHVATLEGNEAQECITLARSGARIGDVTAFIRQAKNKVIGVHI